MGCKKLLYKGIQWIPMKQPMPSNYPSQRLIVPSYADRIWGIWGPYYSIPKAILYLLKGDYNPEVILTPKQLSTLKSSIHHQTKCPHMSMSARRSRRRRTSRHRGLTDSSKRRCQSLLWMIRAYTRNSWGYRYTDMYTARFKYVYMYTRRGILEFYI